MFRLLVKIETDTEIKENNTMTSKRFNSYVMTENDQEIFNLLVLSDLEYPGHKFWENLIRFTKLHISLPLMLTL